MPCPPRAAGAAAAGAVTPCRAMPCAAMLQACKGHMPTPAEAATYDVILIGGSHYSVYEEHSWIRQLLQLVPQYAANHGTRIYGCCFGCQVSEKDDGDV